MISIRIVKPCLSLPSVTRKLAGRSLPFLFLSFFALPTIMLLLLCVKPELKSPAWTCSGVSQKRRPTWIEQSSSVRNRSRARSQLGLSSDASVSWTTGRLASGRRPIRLSLLPGDIRTARARKTGLQQRDSSPGPYRRLPETFLALLPFLIHSQQPKHPGVWSLSHPQRQTTTHLCMKQSKIPKLPIGRCRSNPWQTACF
jgi:hypothetical protein